MVESAFETVINYVLTVDGFVQINIQAENINLLCTF